MLRNYVKFAFRNFRKNKEYAFINILGLAVGLAAFIIIFLFLQFQFDYDKFNNNYENIYRVDQHIYAKGEVQSVTGSQFPLGPALKQDYPEILEAARIMFCRDYLSADEEHTFFERGGLWADNELFNIFDYKFIEGNPETALKSPMSIVLTKELADKYFPNTEAVGKTIRFQTANYLNVTGVVENPPANSTVRPRYIISFPSLKTINGFDIDNNWMWWMCNTYVLLADNVNPDEFSNKIEGALQDYSDINPHKSLLLWPLSKMSMQFNDQNDQRPFYYLIGGLAIITLLIASINFMNLATAYSSTRTKEIGIKKLVGSQRSSLINQFLSEAIIIAAIAMVVAFVLAELFLPQINTLISEKLVIHYFGNYQFILFILLVTVATGLLAGSYPAFFLTATKPISAIKGNVGLTSKNPIMRKILVVFQFALSVALIAGTIIIKNQMDYMAAKELGFDSENLLVGQIQLTGENADNQYNALYNELMNDPRISNMTWSHNAPYFGGETWECRWEGGPADQNIQILHNHVDYNFLDTYGISLAAGRNLSKDFPSDKQEACLINESAAKRLGWSPVEALGKTITNEQDYRIVGVMKDFHLYTVAASIRPYFVSYTTRELSWGNVHTIKLASNQNYIDMRKYVTSKFKEYFPGHNIEFSVYDENLEQRNYSGINVMGEFFVIFATIAISIAVVGLFGLVSFISTQRTREIGIRKTVGAPVTSIVYMLLNEFIRLLLIAVAIAAPIAWVVMEDQLHNFDYRIDISLWVFILAGLITLAIALFTVSFKAIKAARANPIDSLKYE